MLYPAARSAQPSKPPVQRTILLVEDEPFLREVTRDLLESAGFSVLAAENAIEAVQIYDKHEPSIEIVMTDMILPGSTGQQLGQDLRKRCPQLSVLVTSGYSDAGCDIEDYASQTYFLAKPYSRRELLGKIETILDQAVHCANTQAS
jgi:two-component system, cell cycle sensor histidine kinase and response regulator CckA